MILSCAYGVVEYFQESRPPTCSNVRRHKFTSSWIASSLAQQEEFLEVQSVWGFHSSPELQTFGGYVILMTK